MKKVLASVLTCTLLAPVLLSGNSLMAQADSKKQEVVHKENKKKQENDRKGLLGYYFKGKDFNDLVTFAPTLEKGFIYDTETADTLLHQKSQEYGSIRWIGFIKSEEAGNFTFKLTDDENAIIEIEGKVVSNQGKEKQEVYLEKGKLIPIRVEYRPSKQLKTADQPFKDLQLYKINDKQKTIPVEQVDLRNPDFRTEASQKYLTKAAKATLFPVETNADRDTDGDGIPDAWEENGYTIQNKVAVEWQDSLENDGYIKYTSNPLDAYTVGDPYTDYEKAARDTDKSNAKETFHPLVAAFPSVSVNLEKIIISENKDLTNAVGSNSSNNHSYTNTEGASVNAGFGPMGFSFGVSANYQHSDTVGTQWGHSQEDTTHLNNAQAGFLNANVRYKNVGTGSIYNTKPTTSFVLDGDTIGTIKAKENTTALSITPGKSYPKKEQNGIAINTMDDFNSQPITLNKEQLTKFLGNVPIMLETDQVEGQYMRRNIHGETVIGGEWNGITQQIYAKTASIIVEEGDSVSEKRIAAKDYEYPEDKTPSLTLKEGLKLGYPDEIQEKDGLLYYKNKPLYESSVMTYLDERTSKEVMKQINDTTGNFKDVKKLYDVKLTPEMNFTIKVSTLYTGAEDDTTSNIFGALENVYIGDGGNTGKKHYYSADAQARLVLNNRAKNKLKKNTDYYLSMYMIADKDTEPQIKIYGQKGMIASKSIKLNNKAYQRVDILVSNLEGNEMENIYILGSGGTKVSWDDISFTEVSSMKEIVKMAAAIRPNGMITGQAQDEIVLWDDLNKTNQKWRLVYDKRSEAFQIKSVTNENQVLSIGSNYTIHMKENNQTYGTYWNLEESKDGYFFIKSKAYPNIVLDVDRANTENGTRIKGNAQHPITSPYVKAQLFKFIK
ncbi:binary toxin-like calcium binding domain-containing protein [Bacillus thuringiensis]|uniref:binary toxin-like calcium binding domain-containing protein n=1 Tax=Bacillus thuringiensis TaxID=1428 RepID=UPI0015CF7361|nr:binary toxin-like calcium binding domain-containing protein [Bacillus thuringiensis]